jgi:hypothetical protein
MIYRLSFRIFSFNLAVLVAIVANQTVGNSDNEELIRSFLTPFQCSEVQVDKSLACYGRLRQQNNHSHNEKKEVI